MAYEIRTIMQLQDGTLRKPVWQVFDEYGSDDWNITRATFQVRHVNSGTIIASGDSDLVGEVEINNSDEDRAGNPIKTVRPTIDLRDTDTFPGSYKMSFHIYLDTGEDDVVRQPVQLVNYEGV
jgi:hypothetical protein